MSDETQSDVTPTRLGRGGRRAGAGRPPVVDWQCPRVQAVLLSMSRARAARYLGVPKATVSGAANRLGLVDKPPPIDWSRWDHLIGYRPDREVAEIMTAELRRPVLRWTVQSRRRQLGRPGQRGRKSKAMERGGEQ